MAYLQSTHKVVHVTLSGKMLSGAEEWQTGFYLGQPDADATAPTQAAADYIRDKWATFFAHTDASISNSFTFDAVKMARLAVDGLYDGTDIQQAFPGATVQGGAGGAPLPPQVALVATLVAGSGKGYAGKGRMYLPGVSQSINTSGHIGGTWCQTMATLLAGFFNDVNGSIDMPGQVINVSRGSKKLLGVGARNVPVNGVRIGDVFDTQRRRRNALHEVYYSATVAD